MVISTLLSAFINNGWLIFMINGVITTELNFINRIGYDGHKPNIDQNRRIQVKEIGANWTTNHKYIDGIKNLSQIRRDQTFWFR
jgi:hypothetical protein